MVIEMIESVVFDGDGEQQVACRLVGQARMEGVELVGPGGLLAGLMKQVLETVLEEGLSEYLGHGHGAPKAGANERNGTGVKTVGTEIGLVGIEVPRDRGGSFEPRIVKKRRRRFDGID